MGRSFAGILGTISFITVICRGMVTGKGVESTVMTAIFSLFVLAAVGGLVGTIARWVVEDSVRFRFADALAARKNMSESTDEAQGVPAENNN